MLDLYGDWAYDVSPLVVVCWFKPSEVDRLYGEVPNCAIDFWTLHPYSIVYTNPTFLAGLSRAAWQFTIAHELGHRKHQDRSVKRERAKEIRADLYAVELCLEMGHHPLSAFAEIRQRFSDWLRSSVYEGSPSGLYAEDELLCRYHCIRQVMETL